MCDELGIPRPGADGSVDLRGGESAEPMWSALTRKYDIAFIKREIENTLRPLDEADRDHIAAWTVSAPAG